MDSKTETSVDIIHDVENAINELPGINPVGHAGDADGKEPYSEDKAYATYATGEAGRILVVPDSQPFHDPKQPMPISSIPFWKQHHTAIHTFRPSEADVVKRLVAQAQGVAVPPRRIKQAPVVKNSTGWYQADGSAMGTSIYKSIVGTSTRPTAGGSKRKSTMTG